MEAALEQFGIGRDTVTPDCFGGFLTWLQTGDGPQVMQIGPCAPRFGESTSRSGSGP